MGEPQQEDTKVEEANDLSNNEDVENNKQGIPSSSSSSTTKRNLNSYYGDKIGFLQSLSLILNVGLMIYAHVGLSAVIMSSQDPDNNNCHSSPADNNDTSNNNTLLMDLCLTEADLETFTDNGGAAARSIHSNFCSREYNGGCFLDKECIQECFQTNYGYTKECSKCFADIPQCSFDTGCALPCATQPFGAECKDCNAPCTEKLSACTGLPEIQETSNDNTSTKNLQTTGYNNSSTCHEYDPEEIENWYTVYNLTFFGSVDDAWNGDAELLAVIVVIFSGFWPYAKNIILLIVWYVPMSVEMQTSTILWLSRLSKYTLVDVFAVIVVLVGVQLQLDIGGTQAVIRAEPRFGTIAFFLATIWEFLQIEIIKAMHERKLWKEEDEGRHHPQEKQEGVDNANAETSALPHFSDRWIPMLLLLASIGLYVAGAITDLVQFTSSDVNNIGTTGGGCVKSYNLVTLGNALINDLSLTDNSVAWQTWILYLVYILLNLALPVIVYFLQIAFLTGWARQPSSATRIKKARTINAVTIAFWCFACVEVVLIGIFAVEFKFSKLITKIAGECNAVFLDITSGLGPGFYLLIAYSVVAGFLQFSLRIRSSDKTPATTGLAIGDDGRVQEENNSV